MRSSNHTGQQAQSYFDSIADQYDSQMGAAGNHELRRCFQQVVEVALPTNARILDFGAGTGLDTLHFAKLGHRVTAYDVSSGMLSVLKQRCARHISSGDVHVCEDSLDDIRETLLARSPFDAIICNYAVLNLIGGLAELFSLFGKLVRPGGLVLAAIQNPWFPGDMWSQQFWKALAGAPFTGGMRYSSVELGRTFRYTRRQIERAAFPHFKTGHQIDLPCVQDCFGRGSTMRLVALHRA